MNGTIFLYHSKYCTPSLVPMQTGKRIHIHKHTHTQQALITQRGQERRVILKHTNISMVIHLFLSVRM